MISENSFTKEWVMSVNKRLGWNRKEVQLKNLEKAIAALYLLEGLVKAKLDFIFKGGTSLLLLLGKIHRLSVDIDLIIENPINNAEEIFSGICTESKIFYRFEKDERERDKIIHTEHYKFYYHPFIDDTEESYIILDLYCAPIPYAKTLQLELKSDILCMEGENVHVRVPDIESILGDKLTAFAPTTIGIKLSAEPGHRSKRVEVLKQLYDIGNLFDYAEDIENIRKSYYAVAAKELEKYGSEITLEDVLKDSANYACIIGHCGKVENEKYKTIEKSYREFNKYVADLSFDENQAVLAAAKVAYLVKMLPTDEITLEKYDEDVDMLHWEISDKPFAGFNEYKYSNPEAFFYWFMALEANKLS